MLDATGLVLHDLGDDEMLVALPPGHPAAAGDTVAIAELAQETWISNTDRTCSLMLRHGTAAAGFEPRVAFSSDDYGAVGRLVLAGVGVALIPELASPGAGDAVELRRLDPPLARSLHVALPPAPSAAATAMLPCSGLPAIDPLRAHRRAPAPERVEQRLRARRRRRASRGARR